MPIIKDAKIVTTTCTCGKELYLVQSPKNGKYYIACQGGDFINEAIESPGGWKVKTEKRETQRLCLVCGSHLIEYRKPDKTFLACSKKSCHFIVFASEDDLIDRCPLCKYKGYLHRDTTKGGKKITRCSNKDCGFIDFGNHGEEGIYIGNETE